MKTIYFVRHGEAEINTKPAPKYYQGGTSPLTELGHRQAGIIAERASKLYVDVLIASTMKRAQQTAQHIAERIGRPIESSDLFEERRDPTSFIGTVWGDPERQRLYTLWEQTLFSKDERVLDGENFTDVTSRAKAALDFLENRDESKILVVAHGFFLRALAAHVLLGGTMTPEQFKLFDAGFRTNNTGLTVFTYGAESEGAEPRWILQIWNDHSHLAD